MELSFRERMLWGAAGIAGLLAIMQLSVMTGLVSSNAMPTAVGMLAAFANLVVSQTFLAALLATLVASVLAFLLASVVGIPLGVILGTSRTAEKAVSGLVETLRPVPAIALMPIAILSLGIGLEMKVALAALASLWPVLISTIAGVRDTDSMMVRAGRSFTWSGLKIMRRIQLPAALPFIISGARQSVSLALVIVVTLELLGAREGIGDIIRQYGAAGRVDYVFAGVLATGLLGLALHAVLGRVERRLMHWAPQYRKASK
ncbi:ABC transporter permease [Leucobacter ruminantium]|uniref:ABC transporter permease n=1 Tax=Leucobacter ruminantium TaxID=1289170 RepID=A0A939M012_9MICO|nr:ABC transporter permease [Leucobacter ruminantium]MBO1804570.1 ABC transporter permease [Leucobacter ruminantium]